MLSGIGSAGAARIPDRGDQVLGRSAEPPVTEFTGCSCAAAEAFLAFVRDQQIA
jgi:hypothetical protein